MLQLGLYALLLSQSPTWGISPNGMMQRDGLPYAPVGARISGGAGQIEEATKAGIKDLLIEMPVGGQTWAPTLDALQQSGANYFLEINSMTPKATGYNVEPESFRVEGVTGPYRLNTVIPGCTEALVVLAGPDRTEPEIFKISAQAGGKFDTLITPRDTYEKVLLVYPLMQDGRIPDAWEGLDDHRDQLMASLKLGGELQGLRGIIDPIGSLAKFPDAGVRFVPSSARFRNELEAYLRGKYGSQRRIEQAWSIPASDLPNIAAIARLVPLWSGKRGIPFYWDPVQNRSYLSDSRTSSAWLDIQNVLQTAIRRRVINISESLRLVTNAPVMQTWKGWNGPYEGNTAQLSGVAIKLNGDTLSDLIEQTSRAASTLSRWPKKGLFLATDIRVPNNDDRFLSYAEIMQDSASLGVRGWFFTPQSPDDLRWIAMRKGDVNLADLSGRKTRVQPFPEAALNPALAMRIGTDTWWVPSPMPGNRLDFGTQFRAFRIKGEGGDQTVIWSRISERKVKFRLKTPKDAKFATMEGEVIKGKVSKNHVEITIGEKPVVVTGPEVPVPEICADEALAEFSTLLKAIPEQAVPFIDEVASFRVAASNFNTAPGVSYQGMRSRLDRLRKTIGPHIWIEAELSKDHNWSEPISVTGASNGGALSIVNRLATPGTTFQANYRVTPKVSGSHAIWIAMRGSRAAMQSLRIGILDQEFTGEGVPQSWYGEGFGWVKVGVADLTAIATDITLSIAAPIDGSLAVDAIALANGDYTPNGPYLNWTPLTDSAK